MLSKTKTMSANLASRRSLPLAFQHWRLELFFKSPEDLRSQLPFLQRHNIKRINITNKTNEDQLLETARTLQAAIPELDLCLHYSIKYNYARSPAATLAKLQDFCLELQQLQQGMIAQAGSVQEAHSSCHILLVSGGGKRKALDTTAALQQLQMHNHQSDNETNQKTVKRPRIAAGATATALPNGNNSFSCSCNNSSRLPYFAVAFNPYLPDEQEANLERKRLRAKLETGLVDKIYLQMGTDLDRLGQALEYAGSLINELYTGQGKQAPQMLGSVFIPSKRLLTQMRFRPWNGVFLSEEYLSNVEAAERVTQRLLEAYAAAGVTPLVETAVKADAELEHVLDLLSLKSN